MCGGGGGGGGSDLVCRVVGDTQEFHGDGDGMPTYSGFYMQHRKLDKTTCVNPSPRTPNPVHTPCPYPNTGHRTSDALPSLAR